jgi:hypothetical protein
LNALFILLENALIKNSGKIFDMSFCPEKHLEILPEFERG